MGRLSTLSVPTTEDPAIDTTKSNSKVAKTFIGAGQRLAESFLDGPAYWDETTKTMNLIGPNVSLKYQADQESGTNRNSIAPPKNGSNTYLQDTRDWFAHHNGAVNILMADGSVQSFKDLNGDGYLNPGFPVPNNMTDDEYGRVGFRDSQVELPPSRIFSGVFLRKQSKGNFE